ncbi:MAG: hypothetical protein UX58_C0005G0054 [Candidatus Wolfebacteria bacterium GW2011_GWB2_46_69]|uniref:Uncharacterized protein n=2 Tax=Candidatus Wolfeibacteriota TaxID=1752735 RepID=A0A0G1WHA9_9BACT|nr:MAG: hypothetical protein UX70_C0001G0304 [Candidatus Wolfebacteria bacterium GW2011_GWB1_47_1]KKU41904.1 MAG: hypothetical protein UX58_C0005G0054 [Candidatus Wolfebacteria bacterium GW2011_GWB2_46_69]KKU59104.1 MAG: hypothetical protein UX83_C0008G0054 [Candidatus Wolfebacteria bacterium GW2011_GWE2_47_12]KKU65679.1 MAG: hypothetical protein UX90_C0002G0055 [Candidatus Wolfebacteria bacterium GW2011_GWD2_47_17]KKU89708.1 MAG: hypothetical protein UY19_C0010G0041 [Candidatus Wolfebacteria b
MQNTKIQDTEYLIINTGFKISLKSGIIEHIEIDLLLNMLRNSS